jgi:hypothetical protein
VQLDTQLLWYPYAPRQVLVKLVMVRGGRVALLACLLALWAACHTTSSVRVPRVPWAAPPRSQPTRRFWGLSVRGGALVTEGQGNTTADEGVAGVAREEQHDEG